MKDFTTICEILLFQGQNFNNKTALNFNDAGKLKSFSNEEFLQQAFYFAAFLKESGVKKGISFANISYQNPIWLIVDFGAILAGCVSVPIFENISFDHLIYELEDANVEYLFCDDEEIFAQVKKEKPGLKIITRGFKKEGHLSFEEIVMQGKILAEKYEINDLAKAIKEDDLATIIYTSGSTGLPKGVELTHKNLVLQVKGAAKCFKFDAKKDVILSFLPLAHIFERMVVMFYISQGLSIYFADDIKKLGEILKEVKPTCMTTVPRLLEKVFAKIKDGINESSFIKKLLGNLALNRALTKDPTKKRNIFDHFFAKIIYQKFLVGLGGNMRMVICGGAPLSVNLQKFYQNIGVNLFCGYGMTENAPVVAVNYPGNVKIGTVGKIFDGVKVKIAADKELLITGPCVMKGYHNKKEETAKAMQDGWFKTGDLAKLDEEGFLSIVGRKKEAFKNAYGKYVHPVEIEQNLMHKLSFLLGVIVIGEGKKFTSALLFPDFDLLEKIKIGLKFDGSYEEFLQSQILQKHVFKKIAQMNEHLDSWEQIKQFAVIKDKIAIETGQITPSMKLKRAVLEKEYADVIAGFYQD